MILYRYFDKFTNISSYIYDVVLSVYVKIMAKIEPPHSVNICVLQTQDRWDNPSRQRIGSFSRGVEETRIIVSVWVLIIVLYQITFYLHNFNSVLQHRINFVKTECIVFILVNDAHAPSAPHEARASSGMHLAR